MIKNTFQDRVFVYKSLKIVKIIIKSLTIIVFVNKYRTTPSQSNFSSFEKKTNFQVLKDT